MISVNKRSLFKSLSWRLFAFIILIFVSFLALNDTKTSLILALCYNVVQVIMYYIHERIWNLIRWGKPKGIFIQMTGLSGAGKSTLAFDVGNKLRKKGHKVEIIDGDEYREGLCKDLGFSKEDRNTNIRRLGFVGKVLSRNNVITIMSAINPYDSIRQELKNNCGATTVYIKCSLDKCVERDVKGLYKKALSGEIKQFTGISDPFEEPSSPDLIINTDSENLEQSSKKLEDFILKSIM